MNKEAVLELANFMEQHTELPFDMARMQIPRIPEMASKHCSTAGCIGGFAAALWPQVAAIVFRVFDEHKLGIKLDLPIPEINMLCFHNYTKEGRSIEFWRITREDAIITLRRLAETGQVYFEPSLLEEEESYDQSEAIDPEAQA